MSSLIGRIVCQPSAVRPGESVKVEAFDVNDNPLDAAGGEVTINGVPGAIQFLQFPTAGQRRVIVRARSANGETDRQVATIDVAGEPLEFLTIGNKNDIAMLGVTQLPTQAYTAVLSVGTQIDTRSPHSPTVNGSGFSLHGFGFDAATLASRLGSQGVLGRAMTANPSAVTSVQARRLTATRPTPLITNGNGSRPQLQPVTRRAVATVYDLTAVDLGKYFPKASTPMQFEWDFGDGHSATTETPVVNHDYFAAIDHASGIGHFLVTCNIKHAGITVRRSLTIHSAYAICKRTGTVVPHVTADLFAHKQYQMIRGMLTVHNVEDEPLILNKMSITPTSDDGDAVVIPRPFITLDNPVTIPAKSISMIGVNVEFVTGTPQNGQLHYNDKGFSVVYGGTTTGMPVRVSAVFDIPVEEWGKKPQAIPLPDVPPHQRKPWPWDEVENAFRAVVNPGDPAMGLDHSILDAKTGTVAVALGALDSSTSRAVMRAKGERVLSTVLAPVASALQSIQQTPRVMTVMSAPAQAPRIAMTTRLAVGAKRAPQLASAAPVLAGLDIGGSRGPIYALDGPPMPGFIAEGQVCDPDNLTEGDLAAADAGQLVCQLTTETKDVLMPARWMNARKGDCILSPGGDGIIGGLMLNVKPAQWYSHSGIMTRNYDEITHSTGSQDRLMDHLIGLLSDGSDGFEPKVLKYIWPGAIRQTVQASIEGENFPDPEYDKSYKMSAFGPHAVGVTHNDQFKMIPPLVLKPDPMQETPAVRTALHAIATDAANDAGRPDKKTKYHYRWYCYTDPTIGQGAPEGPDAGWAAGTHASVCSSYIWMHAKARSAHLETDQALVTPTDLEPNDVANGATVRPTTPDGLYNYSADERSAAAHWLYDTIYNQAYEKAGWFGEILTDGADDVANQFLNAFANDDADGKDSDEWETVTDADAISPDNMLWWDGPALGGLYGYAEPALYREPRVESYTVSKWKKVLSRGTVRGTIFDEHGPTGGAIVQVFDGKTTFSAANGSYSLTDVPLGSYLLKSSKVIDGVLYSAQVNINVNSADQVVDIHLQPPAERYRLAQIFIDFFGRDYENFGDDELLDPGPEYFELELGPDKLINSASRTYHWGGEVRVEYTITLRLLVNNTIDVEVQGKLFEGTSEDTDDLDGVGSTGFQVGVGATTGSTLTITNTDEDDDDAGVLTLSVKNIRNNN